MKKIPNIKIIIIIIITITIIGLGLSLKRVGVSPTPSPVPTPTFVQTLEAQSKVFFNDNKTLNLNYEFTEGKTAFDLLSETAKKNNLKIETQEYDFGIFIESIGGFENTSDKAWIYYVNEKAGDVASDKYILKDGDIIEWRYETPSGNFK